LFLHTESIGSPFFVSLGFTDMTRDRRLTISGEYPLEPLETRMAF
jgi:hypothetical protein